MKIGQIKRGDVWLVNLNPTLGSEMSKERPAIVVSNNVNNLHSDVITVIPCSSKTDKVYPVEVIITEMKYPSKALCDQIRAISRERFIKKLAEIEARTLAQIEQGILLHLGIYAK